MKRYETSALVVPGGLVLAATIGATSRGFFETLHETVESVAFLNLTSPLDLIGAVSYIKEIKPIAEGLEEIHITTLGIKNIDVSRELKNISLPIELFTEYMRPNALEIFVKEHIPILEGHIVVQVHRMVVRQSPYAQQRNIPLL
jgi:hypothetical protein